MKLERLPHKRNHGIMLLFLCQLIENVSMDGIEGFRKSRTTTNGLARELERVAAGIVTTRRDFP